MLAATRLHVRDHDFLPSQRRRPPRPDASSGRPAEQPPRSAPSRTRTRCCGSCSAGSASRTSARPTRSRSTSPSVRATGEITIEKGDGKTRVRAGEDGSTTSHCGGDVKSHESSAQSVSSGVRASAVWALAVDNGRSYWGTMKLTEKLMTAGQARNHKEAGPAAYELGQTQPNEVLPFALEALKRGLPADTWFDALLSFLPDDAWPALVAAAAQAAHGPRRSELGERRHRVRVLVRRLQSLWLSLAVHVAGCAQAREDGELPATSTARADLCGGPGSCSPTESHGLCQASASGPSCSPGWRR